MKHLYGLERPRDCFKLIEGARSPKPDVGAADGELHMADNGLTCVRLPAMRVAPFERDGLPSVGGGEQLGVGGLGEGRAERPRGRLVDHNEDCLRAVSLWGDTDRDRS